jgi:uncharacterized protein
MARAERTIAIITLLMLTTCGSSPPTHYYTLEPIPPQHSAAKRALNPPIEIGDPGIPPEIDRDAIVQSVGGDRLDISSNDQWGAPIGKLIRQCLTTDLTSRLASGSVLAPGAPAPKSGLYVISVHVERFIADPSGHVVLDASWSVLPAGSSTAIRQGHEQISVQVPSGGSDGAAAGMSQALAQLADRLAHSLG